MLENNEMNQIVSQAKAEARKEKIRQFFAKNGKIFITISAILMVGALSLFALDIYQESQEAKYSEIFQQSLMDQQAGDMEKAKESLKKIVDARSPSGIKALASLRYAGLLFNENKIAEALEIYQKVNDCRGCDAYIKDLGGLLEIRIWLSDETVAPKEGLLAKIEKIESKSSALKLEISEQKALFQMQQGELEKAYLALEAISKNPEVSQNLKSRSEEFLKIIVSKGYEPKIQPVAPEAVKAEDKKPAASKEEKSKK